MLADWCDWTDARMNEAVIISLTLQKLEKEAKKGCNVIVPHKKKIQRPDPPIFYQGQVGFPGSGLHLPALWSLEGWRGQADSAVPPSMLHIFLEWSRVWC